MSKCYRIVLLLVLTTLLTLPVSGSREADAGQVSLSALLVSAITSPLRVLGSDGMEHIEYDLSLTNVFTAPVTLTTVDVIAPDGRVLLQLAGDALAANTQPLVPDNPNAPPISPVPVGGVVYVVIDLVVPPDAVPARISHSIAYALPPDAPFLALFTGRTVSGPELAVDSRAPLVIAPPLRGAGWFNANGCCSAAGSHRFERFVLDGGRYIKGEAFGIDWSRLQGGRPWAGDGAQNEQHFAFGADVLAVADGTVVAVRDDMPDQTLGLRVGLEHPDDFRGNYVIIQILPEVWAHYHHLQPGSITVGVGERVTTGQLVGLLGNSGGSYAPHLHFQLADGLAFYNSNGLPFVLDRYTLAGTVDVEAYVASLTDPTAAASIVGPPSTQTGTYPLVLTVQNFP